MFEVITGGNPDDLSPDTRAAVIRAGVRQLVRALGELPAVVPMMTLDQRIQIYVAMQAAALDLGKCEEQLAAVHRVLKAKSASA